MQTTSFEQASKQASLATARPLCKQSRAAVPVRSKAADQQQSHSHFFALMLLKILLMSTTEGSLRATTVSGKIAAFSCSPPFLSKVRAVNQRRRNSCNGPDLVLRQQGWKGQQPRAVPHSPGGCPAGPAGAPGGRPPPACATWHPQATAEPPARAPPHARGRRGGAQRAQWCPKHLQPRPAIKRGQQPTLAVQFDSVKPDSAVTSPQGATASAGQPCRVASSMQQPTALSSKFIRAAALSFMLCSCCHATAAGLLWVLQLIDTITSCQELPGTYQKQGLARLWCQH